MVALAEQISPREDPRGEGALRPEVWAPGRRLLVEAKPAVRAEGLRAEELRADLPVAAAWQDPPAEVPRMAGREAAGMRAEERQREAPTAPASQAQ